MGNFIFKPTGIPTTIKLTKPEQEELWPLVHKYRPVVYLDNKETCFPVSAEFIMANSELKNKNTGDIIVPMGELSTYILKDHIEHESRDMQINTAHDALSGVEPGVNSVNLKQVPFYYTIYATDKYHVIQYCFMYAYNAPYKLCGLKCLKAGAHGGDFEHITVYVNKSDNKIDKIYYSAHGRWGGKYVDMNDIKFENGRPVVYSSRGSHGCYWRPQTTFRIYCCANDITEAGYRWDPGFIVNLEEVPWKNFKGDVGTIPIFQNQGWYQNENGQNANCCIRIFIPWK